MNMFRTITYHYKVITYYSYYKIIAIIITTLSFIMARVKLFHIIK